MVKSLFLKTFVFSTLLFCLAQAAMAQSATTPVQSAPVVSAESASADSSSNDYSWKKKMAIGLMGFGYYEMNSDYESLYYGDQVANLGKSIKSSGFGFAPFFEYGFGKKISGELSIGYSRLTYADTQRTIIKENYFITDLTMHYHFLNTKLIDLYGLTGLCVYASGGGIAPMMDLGLGSYIKVTPEFSFKIEAIAKSMIVVNRGEARLGVAYHF